LAKVSNSSPKDGKAVKGSFKETVQNPSRSSIIVTSMSNCGISGTASTSAGFDPHRAGLPLQRSWRFRAAERPAYEPPAIRMRKGILDIEPMVKLGGYVVFVQGGREGMRIAIINNLNMCNKR